MLQLFYNDLTQNEYCLVKGMMSYDSKLVSINYYIWVKFN